MKIRSAILVALALVFAGAAYAQDYAQDYPKAEVGLFYTYYRFNPENQPGGFGAFSLNGGGGDITYFFTHSLGVKAEFTGTTSQTQTVALTGAPCVTPGCAFKFQANLFTYNALVVYKARWEKFEPFVETGFGGAHSNATTNVQAACGANCVFTASPSNNSFDFVVGGGIDIPLTRHFAVRPGQFDYVLTRFDTGFTNSNQNQSNFRYQGGVVFRF